MNTERPGDDRQFDTAVDRAWREASNEGPPPRVDEAILEAARSRRRSTGTWQPLAAVAAVAGLAFLLVQLMPTERDVPPPVRMERTAPVESKAAPAQEVGASQESPARQEPAREREVASPAAGVPGPAAPPTAAAPVAANTPAEAGPPDAPTQSVPASNEIAADADADADAGMTAVPATPAARSPLTGKLRESQGASALSRPSQQAWAARVEVLHDAGDLEAAAAELRAFRAAYPDADRYLPDALRDWAASIE